MDMAEKGRAKAAIIGLGASTLSRTPVGSARQLAVQAVQAALADADIGHGEVDGLLINRSPLVPHEVLPLKLQEDLQFANLTLLSSIEGEGSSAVQMIQYAALAIRAGMASNVVCVFADDPIRPAQSGGQAFAPALSISGIPGWEESVGLLGAAGAYALAAQEYLWHYGLDADALSGVVLSDRAWAQRNPDAFLRAPLSLDDYRRSPWVVEPFRVLDCAYPVNGAIAVVVTAADAAPERSARPVYIHGMGQGHGGFTGFRGRQGLTGARLAGRIACEMAGVVPADIDACQFYEAFSFTTLLALEEYGLCPPGEAAAFTRDGHTAPGGRLPCNTGGGHLSGYYLQGMTPVAEAVIQARGHGGPRQLDRADLQLVTGNGGRLDYHAALLLSPSARLRAH
jgi:acetyl-CoA acetyltransferase